MDGRKGVLVADTRRYRMSEWDSSFMCFAVDHMRESATPFQCMGILVVHFIHFQWMCLVDVYVGVLCMRRRCVCVWVCVFACGSVWAKAERSSGGTKWIDIHAHVDKNIHKHTRQMIKWLCLRCCADGLKSACFERRAQKNEIVAAFVACAGGDMFAIYFIDSQKTFRLATVAVVIIAYDNSIHSEQSLSDDIWTIGLFSANKISYRWPLECASTLNYLNIMISWQWRQAALAHASHAHMSFLSIEFETVIIQLKNGHQFRLIVGIRCSSNFN